MKKRNYDTLGVMLDMSSSMDRCVSCGEYTGKYYSKSGCKCNPKVARIDELKDAMVTLETTLKNSPNADNIKIAVADFNGFYGSGGGGGYGCDGGSASSDTPGGGGGGGCFDLGASGGHGGYKSAGSAGESGVCIIFYKTKGE